MGNIADIVCPSLRSPRHLEVSNLSTCACILAYDELPDRNGNLEGLFDRTLQFQRTLK
jgi:hypothetical protein